MYIRPARLGSHTQTDPQTGIRVNIEPSQSAYFAGEPFLCTITFSNVRAGELTKPRPIGGNVKSSSAINLNEGYGLSTPTTTTETTTIHKQHKRSSHSVSSVPLARPPTSPGTPKTATSSYKPFRLGLGAYPEEGFEPKRKGLVGKMDERRRIGRSMSLSVDVAEVQTSPTSPVPQISPSRETGLPPSHPHARKPSTGTPGSLSPDTVPNTTQNSLSTIYENSSAGSPSPTTHTYYPFSAPSTPLGTRPTKPVSLVPQPTLPSSSSSSSSSSGSSSFHPHNVQQPHSAYATTFSPLTTELILYAYAQLTGTFNIDPVAVQNAPEMYALRDRLRKGRVGGGSLDFVVGSGTAGRGGLKRGSSWFGLGGLFGSGNTDGVGAGGAGAGTGIMNSGSGGEDDLPTFETQPSLLAIDLRLAPGESKSYSYIIDLPANLPPTFKGRAMRFSYQFIVGTCRASSGLVPGGGGNFQTSRVMRVPIRVYNHVSIDSPSLSYDLLWPIFKRREKAVAGTVQEVGGMKKDLLDGFSKLLLSPQPTTQPDPLLQKNLQSLKSYAQRLLANDPTLDEDDERENERDRTDGGLGIGSAATGRLTGCREGVEILTRNTRKASYDITKENSKVAELTLVKSAYRLGESVHVVVEFNNDACTSKVLKMSSTLESHEHPPWHPSGPSETIRRIHAEHYSNGTINTRRVGFGLDIPSDASPGFHVVVGDEEEEKKYTSKVTHEWKIRLCLLIAVSSSGKRNALNGSSSTSLSSTMGSSSKGKNKRIEIRNIQPDDSSDNDMDSNETKMKTWGKTWKTVPPMERVTAGTQSASAINAVTSPISPTSPKKDTVPTGLGFTSTASKGLSAWVGIFNPFAAGTYHDADEETEEDHKAVGGSREKKASFFAEDEDEDDDEEWVQMNAETVECLIPLFVYPGNTAYRPVEVVFEV